MFEAIRDIVLTKFKSVVEWASGHVFRSIGSTIAFTIMSIFILLNPWFGSSSAKFYALKYMLGSSTDVEFLFKSAQQDKDIADNFRRGAAEAGYYDEGNRKILAKWADSLPDDPSKIMNEAVLSDDKFDAVLQARRLAFDRKPPFQPIGLRGVASSPSCPDTRPRTGEVYVNAKSDFGRQLNTGQNIMISRADGFGKIVIATVSINPNMNDNTDMYLNRRQMLDFLSYPNGDVVAVKVVITKSIPNQDEQDRYPPESNQIDCSKG